MTIRRERQLEKESRLTANRLRALLDYDRETGIFRWRHSRRGLRAGAIAGRFSGAGYRQICVDCMYFYAHRLAWLYTTGEWPVFEIDHKDTDKTNNRFSNLRPANDLENQGNRPANRNNASGIKGVRWHKQVRKWQARITIRRTVIHLGYFVEKTEAAAAYMRAARDHFGSQFARAS